MGKFDVVVKQTEGVIEFNYEELKADIKDFVDLYKDATLTDESIITGKKELAGLRNIVKEMETRRKEVKNICMIPYKDFEDKVKELTRLIDEPIQDFDKQIKAYEEKKKQEKSLKIQVIYDELAVDVIEYIPLKKIYNPKWENAATSLKSIKEEIASIVDSTNQAIQTITAMNSEHVPKALEQYKIDLSLSNAIQSINNYELQKAEILRKEQERLKLEEERKKQQEIERIKREERERVAEEERIKEETKQEIIIEIEQKQAKLTEELTIKESNQEIVYITSNLTIVATTEEFEQIEMYLSSIGVEYERNDF